MGWWGKIVGGTLGYMLGGPLGALLGAAFGHQFDYLGESRGDGFSSGDTERVQSAFFVATFSIMGHIAKADGRVSEDEISLARHVMDQMQLNEEQKKAAINLFNQGKGPAFPLDEVLDQFREECHRRVNLIQMFMEIQISTALADGELHDTERDVVVRIGEKLGLQREHIIQLLNMVSAQRRYSQAGGPQASRGPSLVDAYRVLGVSEQASDDEIKKAYRKLMSQHHPDKLVAKGLPEEMMNVAKEKTQEIKAAYEQIRKARGR
ncbi:MAG: co-chaperone DjlA [Gammaproteobacteria bacterium]|nr:co-chaperone DjlA [Gammaproteobacteria bacterium]